MLALDRNGTNVFALRGLVRSATIRAVVGINIRRVQFYPLQTMVEHF